MSVRKEQLPYGWAFVFRHRVLGELGRIVLQDTEDGRTHLSYEVVGYENDPMAAKRAAIFKPLAMQVMQCMEAATGPTTDAGPMDPPPFRPPEPKELVEGKLIPCRRCGGMVAMLIFAPGATDAGRFEDYARKMYPEYARRNVPTWILGPALGDGPLMERPADILQVWPDRTPMKRQRPAEFNAMIDQLVLWHCAG
jgi:hypothetical protein